MTTSATLDSHAGATNVDSLFSISYARLAHRRGRRDYRNDRMDSQFDKTCGGSMRAADLDIHELLHFSPEGGVITFAGERVLLLDSVALGLLRRELIQMLGVTAARIVLTRFGYAHGWRVAEMLRKGFPWDSEDEWRAAGARLHTLQGLVRQDITRSSA